MPSLDLNLLVALDVLLSEGSVVRAAERMHLSPPAMSRTLARIRHLLGDPILVRAGRGLVPTPRAEALRERLRLLIEDAQSLVRADPSLDLAALDRIFTIRANDGLVGAFGARMAASMLMVAPRVRLRFVPEGDEDVGALRDGRIDLDIGAMGGDGPELRVQTLFQDRFVGIVRSGHRLAGGNVTPSSWRPRSMWRRPGAGASRGRSTGRWPRPDFSAVSPSWCRPSPRRWRSCASPTWSASCPTG